MKSKKDLFKKTDNKKSKEEKSVAKPKKKANKK